MQIGCANDVDRVAPPAGRHQRVDGAARIAFTARAGLADLYQRAPCRFLFPDGPAGDPPQAVSITTSGGLTGGDRLRVELAIGENAAATIATQAAEKLYRALPGEADTRIDTHVSVGPGGWGEWLGQEAILFDGARVRRGFEAEIAGDARLLAVESLVFGRGAMGEEYRHGRVHDSWRIRRDGRLVWVDVLRLDGDVAGTMALPFGFGEARATATIVYAGADAATHVDLARGLVPVGVRGGATCLDRLLIVRMLSVDPAALKQAVIRMAGALRAAAGGWTDRLPAVWTC